LTVYTSLLGAKQSSDFLDTLIGWRPPYATNHYTSNIPATSLAPQTVQVYVQVMTLSVYCKTRGI